MSGWQTNPMSIRCLVKLPPCSRGESSLALHYCNGEKTFPTVQTIRIMVVRNHRLHPTKLGAPSTQRPASMLQAELENDGMQPSSFPSMVTKDGFRAARRSGRLRTPAFITSATASSISASLLGVRSGIRSYLTYVNIFNLFNYS